MADKDLTVSFKAKTDNVQSGISKLNGAIAGMGKAVGVSTAALAGMAAVAGVALAAGVKDVLAYGGHISDLANRAGVTASSIVVLEEAFRQAGLDGLDVSTVLQKLSNTLKTGFENPASKVNEWMQKLGISFGDIVNLDMAEKFELISDRIGGLGSDTEKTAAASAIFGAKQGLLLVNLIKSNGALKDARTYVGGLGESMNNFAPAFDRVDDILEGAPIKWKQFFAGIAGSNIDTLDTLANKLETLDLTPQGMLIGDALKGIIDGDAEKIAAIGTFIGDLIYEGVAAGIRKTTGYLGSQISILVAKATGQYNEDFQKRIDQVNAYITKDALGNAVNSARDSYNKIIAPSVEENRRELFDKRAVTRYGPQFIENFGKSFDVAPKLNTEFGGDFKAVNSISLAPLVAEQKKTNDYLRTLTQKPSVSLGWQ